MYLRRTLAGGLARRSLLSIAALGAVAAALAVAAAGSSAASRPDRSAPGRAGFTLSVGYIGTEGLFGGPEGFAYSKGLLQKWLKPAGVSSITTAQFANGPLLTPALEGGSVDLGILGDTPALISESQGVSTKLLNQDSLGLAAWIVARKGITSLSQLAGKTIARQQGSYMDRYLQGLLKVRGLFGKVQLVAMLDAQGIPAFEAGSVDAIAVPAQQAGVLTSQGYPVIAKSETTPTLQGTTLTIASTAVLKAHPDLASAWNTARVEALAYAQAHAAAYYAYEAKAGGTGTAATAEEFTPLSDYPTQPFTTAGIKQLQGTLNFLVSAGEAKAFSLAGWEATAS